MRRVFALSILVGLTLAPMRAQATDTQACLGASEKGQRARAEARLREAREQLMICSAEGCPSLVRHDCSQWLVEIGPLIPTVVFGAKDDQGRDLFDVTVSMDGETLVKRLDGKAILVEPGPHTFKFEVPGHPAIVERALVKEGEKARGLVVKFIADGDGSSPPDDKARGPAEDRTHSILPWVVVGAGVATALAGLTIVLASPSLPDGCSSTTRSCAQRSGESRSDFVARQDQAGLSDSQPQLGLIVGVVGLGFVAGGLLWHFLEPTGPRTTALRISPWAESGGAGTTLGASF